jgi:hypothetical protein
VRSAEIEIARRECLSLGLSIVTDPTQALMDELWEAEANCQFYRQLVAQLPSHPGADEFIPPEDDGDNGHWERGETGVYGRTYHVSGIATGEAKPHILVVLYNQERDRRRAVAEAMLRANVEERRVRMVEADAAKILRAQMTALLAVGLGDRLEDFRRAFVDALRASEPVALGSPVPS